MATSRRPAPSAQAFAASSKARESPPPERATTMGAAAWRSRRAARSAATRERSEAERLSASSTFGPTAERGGATLNLGGGLGIPAAEFVEGLAGVGGLLHGGQGAGEVENGVGRPAGPGPATDGADVGGGGLRPVVAGDEGLGEKVAGLRSARRITEAIDEIVKGGLGPGVVAGGEQGAGGGEGARRVAGGGRSWRRIGWRGRRRRSGHGRPGL